MVATLKSNSWLYCIQMNLILAISRYTLLEARRAHAEEIRAIDARQRDAIAQVQKVAS